MKPRSRIPRRQLKAQPREFIRRINHRVGPGTIYGGISWMVESQKSRKTRQIRTINEARARHAARARSFYLRPPRRDNPACGVSAIDRVRMDRRPAKSPLQCRSAQKKAPNSTFEPTERRERRPFDWSFGRSFDCQRNHHRRASYFPCLASLPALGQNKLWFCQGNDYGAHKRHCGGGSKCNHTILGSTSPKDPQ